MCVRATKYVYWKKIYIYIEAKLKRKEREKEPCILSGGVYVTCDGI